MGMGIRWLWVGMLGGSVLLASDSPKIYRRRGGALLFGRRVGRDFDRGL